MKTKELSQIVYKFFKSREKTFKFIYIIFGIILVLTAFRISGSSIGMWNKYLGDDPMKGGVVLGIPRSIRSDEWLVQTPLTLSQDENNYDQINQFIGNGQDTAVIYDAPNKHWSTIFKPHNWGFFVLPQENAFAFKWWFRGAMLIISTYLLLLVLTKRNYFLSISGALILFFTPMVQWWYSIQVMEPIAYGFLSLYFALRILKYESKKRLIFYSIILFYSMIAFALSFYPAFQIPVLYVVLFVFLGYTIENWNEISTNWKAKILALSVPLVLAGMILFAYYYSVKETISTILNTSYPGARFVNGGGYSLIQFLSGPYNFLLQLNSTNVPAAFSNQSEASSFIPIVLFILIMPFILYYCAQNILKKSREGSILFLLTILFLVNVTFIFFGFNNFLAKYSLFYLIPENRMIIGIGLISFLGIIIFINLIREGNIRLNKIQAISISASVISLILIAFIGRELNELAPQFIRNKFVVIGTSALIALFMYLLLMKKEKSSVLLLLAFSIFSAAFVNPLYYGLSPLRDSVISNDLSEINEKFNPENKKWVVYDSMFWGNFLAAQGIQTLNGTHLYPQLETWKKLDTEAKYDYNYNRYSHIIFETNQDTEISFENPVSDTLKIKINPCNKFFKDENVGYLMTQNDMSGYKCLEKVEEKGKIIIYRLK